MEFITDACIIDWAAIPCADRMWVFACMKTWDRLFALTVFTSVRPSERIASWWNPRRSRLCPDLVFTVRRAAVSSQEDGWFPVNHRPTTNGHCSCRAGEQTELKSGTFRPSRHVGCELTLTISHSCLSSPPLTNLLGSFDNWPLSPC